MGGLGERRRFNKSARRLCSQNLVIWALRFSWVILLFLGELGAFYWSIRGCRWPDENLPSAAERPAHVLLVGDAQVRPPSTDASWLGYFHDHLYHGFLKRSWHVAMRLKPHTVIFLGDMLASGRSAHAESDFAEYHAKFQSIFRAGADTPKFYLPGNADVGLGMTANSKDVRRHYMDTFGSFNTELSIRNHTLILLDAPALVEEDYARATRSIPYNRWPAMHGGTVEFLRARSRVQDKIGNAQPEAVILFSHIPLSRPDSSQCGPLRERGRIRRGVGKGYQTMFGKDTTHFLFDLLNPVAVFSADDSDYCEHVHAHHTPPRFIPETTIKSFSKARHITRPGFQLLSLTTPPLFGTSQLPTYAHTPCLLPDQSAIHNFVYMPAIALTLLILILTNVYRSRKMAPSAGLPSLSLPSVSSSKSSSPLVSPSASSPVWSPFTPFVPTSPRSALPLSLRTPSGSVSTAKQAQVPALRSFSRPGTPLLSPMSFPREDDEYQDEAEDNDDEASMYPAQYATPGQNDYHQERSMRSSYFVPAPQSSKLGLGLGLGPMGNGMSSASNKPWSKSWTFVCRGRRRRMTISAPRAASFSLTGVRRMWRDLMGADLPRHRKLDVRDVVVGTLKDCVLVGWVVGLCWVGIEWRLV